MSNEEKIEMLEEKLIPWPASQDAKVWNARVDYLINRLITKGNNEPQNGKGISPDPQ